MGRVSVLYARTTVQSQQPYILLAHLLATRLLIPLLVPDTHHVVFHFSLFCSLQEHWDNNEGRNFEAVCTIPRVKTQPRGGGRHYLGSPPLSPQLNSRNRSCSDGAVHRLRMGMGDSTSQATPHMFLPPQHRHPPAPSSPRNRARSTSHLQSTIDALTGSLSNFDLVESADSADLDTSPAPSPTSSPPPSHRRRTRQHHHHTTSGSPSPGRHRSASAAAVHCHDDSFSSLLTMSVPNLDAAPRPKALQASASATTHPFFLHRNAHEHDTFALYGVQHRQRAHSLKGLHSDPSHGDDAGTAAGGAGGAGHHGDTLGVMEALAAEAAGLQA